MKRNQNGFSLVESLIILVIFGVVIFAGYSVYSRQEKQEMASNSDMTGSLSKNSEFADISLWQKDCNNDGPRKMTHTPMNIEDLQTITPLGSYAGAHVTPIDHLYFYPPLGSPRDKYPVFAMADGYIVDASRRTYGEGGNAKSEYRLVFQHSCSLFSYFDLITSLSPEIENAIPELKSSNYAGDLHIPVKAGQEVGRIGAQSLDTAIYDSNVTLNFITPELYKSEFWKIHTAPFFEYFDTEQRNQMLAKNPRTAEPRSGKIDHDRPGKLIGNWFVEGTNGYAGDPKNERNDNSKENQIGYWSTHLSFSPDPFQPDKLVASIGNYNNEARQFSIKGNAPDFASVGIDSGIVKYELIGQKIYNSDDPIQINMNKEDGAIIGTILVEVLDGEKLRFEIFDGKTADQVNGFSDEAIMYER